ncbi:MAG: hypothetical protein NTY04_01590, partial [Candidatus Staskawiczbacteria bacterium]|nr:hypothetical protein [Candidatus Staskawiczbacteria bacterium]
MTTITSSLQNSTSTDTGATALPGLVLCGFNINGYWRERFLRAGVPMEKLDTRTVEVKRATASGVQVFGKDGLKMVSLIEVVKELADI